MLIAKVLRIVLGWTARKAGMVLVLFFALLLIGTLHQGKKIIEKDEANRDRLAEIAQEKKTRSKNLEELKRTYAENRAEAQVQAIESLTARAATEVRELNQTVAKQKSKVKRLRQDEDKECGLVDKAIDAVVPGPSACETARELADAANKTLRTYNRNRDEVKRTVAVLNDPRLTNRQKLERLREEADPAQDARTERRIENEQSELNDLNTEEETLREDQDSAAGWAAQKARWVAQKWAQSWMWLLGIVLLGAVLPWIWRTVGYFLVMPVVSRAKMPLPLSAEPEHSAATIQSGSAERTLPIRLSAGEVLSAREEYVVPVQGRKAIGKQARSQILYDWSSPFISYAAGLHSLTRITGDEDGTAATLAAPDASTYLMRIDFEDHPGVVIHPKHVVGVMGSLELEKRWRWRIQSLATCQVRYIMFVGTGSLIVQGSGDVAAENPGDRPMRIEQERMMGFDSRLTASVNRTETFWPYLRGKTQLVDDEFTGPYPFFWQKSKTGETSNPMAKTFNNVFSAIGKLLGF